MNYGWLAACVAIVVAAWLIGRSINYLAEQIAQNAKISREANRLEQMFSVSQTAATLIGAALNNPAYVARMQDLRADLKKVSELKFENWQANKAEERKQAETLIRQYEEQLSVTDIFQQGHRPYVDLPLKFRDLCQNSNEKILATNRWRAMMVAVAKRRSRAKQSPVDCMKRLQNGRCPIHNCRFRRVVGANRMGSLTIGWSAAVKIVLSGSVVTMSWGLGLGICHLSFHT